ARRLPSGDRRGSLSQYGVWSRSMPSGQSIRASDADRMLIATRSLPSGDQSAEFMPSASSRAAPPEIEARASVPVGLKTMPWWRALTSSAMSPAGEIDSTSARGGGSGLESGAPGRVEKTVYGSPSQAAA